MPLAQLNDIVLHYVSLEKPRPSGARREEVVMVHGLGANLGFWYLQIAPMLSAYARVTLFDLRGHGLSGMPKQDYGVETLAADMNRLFDHLGIESAHVIAHSFGGSVATRFACENAKRVKSLMLLDTRLRAVQPHLRLSDWSHWPRYRRLMSEIGLELDGDGDFGTQLFDHMARMRLNDPAQADRLSAKFHSPFSGESGRRSALRWLQLLETTSAREEFLRPGDVVVEDLRSLRMPIMGIYGEYSHAISTAEVLPQLCPQTEIRLVPRAGHFFPLTMPDRVIEPAIEFIGQRDKTPASANTLSWGLDSALPLSPLGT